MASKRPRKRASFGVLFWIGAILLVLVLLMFNMPTIRTVLDRTDFIEVVFQDRSGTEASPADPADESPATEAPESVSEPAPSGESTDPRPAPPDAPDTPDVPEEPEAESPTGSIEDEPAVVVAPPTRESEETGPQRSMQGSLYFIRVSDDGRIIAEPVRRTIRYDEGPLTSVMETLISGPSADDLNRGLLSLIPQGTVLQSARVASGVAFLSFNEAFRFNPMGLEGLLAQLQQIVLTATQFSTVDAVQILIDGRTLEYLGGDGVYVGEPLAPGDLRS